MQPRLAEALGTEERGSVNSCHFWPKSIETNLDIELNDRKTVCSAQHSITKPAAAHGYEVQMTSILRLLSPVGTHVSPYYPSFLRTICSSYVFQPKPNWGGTRLFGLHLPTTVHRRGSWDRSANRSQDRNQWERLAPMACSVGFVLQPKTTCPGVAQLTHQILIK